MVPIRRCYDLPLNAKVRKRLGLQRSNVTVTIGIPLPVEAACQNNDAPRETPPTRRIDIASATGRVRQQPNPILRLAACRCRPAVVPGARRIDMKRRPVISTFTLCLLYTSDAADDLL